MAQPRSSRTPRTSSNSKPLIEPSNWSGIFGDRPFNDGVQTTTSTTRAVVTRTALSPTTPRTSSTTSLASPVHRRSVTTDERYRPAQFPGITGSGKQVRFHTRHVFEFRDGRIPGGTSGSRAPGSPLSGKSQRHAYSATETRSSMSAQTIVDETTRFEQLLADLQIPSGVTQQLADAVAQASAKQVPRARGDRGQMLRSCRRVRAPG